MGHGLLRATVAIVGLPGAGKTTLSLFLAERFGAPRLSTGEALRKLATSNSALASRLAAGEMGPETIVSQLVDSFLASTSGRLRILDGFPRHLAQAMTLREQCDDLLLFALEVPVTVAVARLARRGSDERADDGPATVRRRVLRDGRGVDEVVDTLRDCVIRLDGVASAAELVLDAARHVTRFSRTRDAEI